jgi:hypothetical protein
VPILTVVAYRPEDSAAERDLIAQLGRLGSHRIGLVRLADDHAAEIIHVPHPEYGIDVDRVAELARHWDAAEVASRALHWLVAAADQAQASYAFEARSSPRARDVLVGGGRRRGDGGRR